MDLLNDRQAAAAEANRLFEIMELPPGQRDEHLARYRAPSINANGQFEIIAQDMPNDLLTTVSVHDQPIPERAREWIERVSPVLDDWVERLRAASVEFGLSPEQYWGLGWKRLPITPAERTCQAFLTRAYLRARDGDHSTAAADIVAARHLARDIGDGILMAHRTTSAELRRSIYAFIEYGLKSHHADPVVAEIYVELAISDTPIPSLSAALLPRELGFVELMSAAMVSDDGERERLDFAYLDSLLGGFLTDAGAMASGSSALALTASIP